MTDPSLTDSASYAAPTNSMAIVSLAAGILGLTLFPIVGSIVALVTGMTAKQEIRDGAGTLGGAGLASAGVVLGWIGIALGLLGICCALLVILVPLLLIPLNITWEGSGLILPMWLCSLVVQ